jgi:hypothetical protein
MPKDLTTKLRAGGTPSSKRSERFESSPAENKKARIAASLGIAGAGDRNRTYDLRVTSALLYRLSYTGGSVKINTRPYSIQSCLCRSVLAWRSSRRRQARKGSTFVGTTA